MHARSTNSSSLLLRYSSGMASHSWRGATGTYLWICSPPNASTTGSSSCGTLFRDESGYHIRSLSFLVRPILFSSPVMDRIATLTAEWERAKAGTQDYLAAIGADHLSFRPAEGSWSLAEQFLHLASTQYAFAASATGRAKPVELSSAD